MVGTTARLDALQAALLRVKLRRLDGCNDDRRRIGAALRARPRGHEPRAPGRRASRTATTSTTCSSCARQREALRAFLGRAGVATASTTRSRSTAPAHTRSSASARAACRWPSGSPRRSARCRCSRRCPTTSRTASSTRSRTSTGDVMTAAQARDRPPLRAVPRAGAAAPHRGRRLRLLGPEPRPQRDRAARSSSSPRCASATTPRGGVPRRRCPDVPVYADLDTVLDDPTIDAVLVATPPRTHHAIVSRRARAGKHVLVEKPLARRRRRPRDLIEIADARRPGADARAHVPLQPAGQQGQRADRPGRPRRGLLRHVVAHEPRQVPARRRHLRPRAARHLDPAVPARRSRSCRSAPPRGASSASTYPRWRSSRSPSRAA